MNKKLLKKIKDSELTSATLALLNKLRNPWKKPSYIISYPKCGRTWVSTVFLHYVGKTTGKLENAHDFSLNPNSEHREFFRLNRSAIFTHDKSNRHVAPEELTRKLEKSFRVYEGMPVGFLIRDPRDVIVSHYHHVLKRAGRMNFPKNTTISEYIKMPGFGIQQIITFYNFAAHYARAHERVQFFRYEELRGKDGKGLEAWKELLSFTFEQDIDEKILQWSLEQSAFDKMKNREQEKSQTSRVRKGKIGGYTDELDADSIAYIEQVIDQELDAFFSFYKAPYAKAK